VREILDVGVWWRGAIRREPASLAWLAGFEAATVESITEVIIRARQTP
jgi:hypothetical protein